MKNLCILIAVLLTLSLPVLGQTTPTPAASPDQDDVVRITTKLVQFDIIVVDKDGKQVRDLQAVDFQVLQDGKPQQITNFSYVNTEPPAKAASGGSTSTLAVPGSTTGKRILTFVVDDGNCSATNAGMHASREGIEKFIREQMQPNDLVAIYQTRAGSSMLQQYTSDKTQLLRSAKNIRWRPPLIGSCAADNADGSTFEAARTNTLVKQSPFGTTTETVESGSQRSNREHVEDAQANNQTVGTLGALRYIIQGLRHVPGRKVVFFMSDGLPLRERGGGILSARDALGSLTELANRSSVVFNTIDPRGVTGENLIEARDQVYVQDSVALADSISRDRTAFVSSSRDGLDYLATETGGKFIHDQNYLDVPISKALALETGYYLLAYDPSDDAFKGKKFNKIEIKVNRPGLKVVSRAGFQGVVDQGTTTRKPKSADSDMYEALTAPLPRPGIDLGLTAYYVNSPETGDMVRALIHIDGKAITFTDEPGGLKKAVFDVVAVTMDEKNKIVDEFNRSHTYKVDAKAMPVIMQNGLVYSTDVIVQKPGTYNFRVAVKDETSKQIGSSSQIVDVPDLKKSRAFASALTLSQVDAKGKFVIPAAAKPDNAVTLTMTAAVPAIRRFRRGSILAYAYTLYNAALDPATGQPKVSVQVKLYRNGELVIDGKPQEAQFDKQGDWTRVSDYGYMQLKPQMELGDYTIQIIIKDLLAKGKAAETGQSADFEVVE
jgi:VWFA-related protein